MMGEERVGERNTQKQEATQGGTTADATDANLEQDQRDLCHS